MLTAAMLPVIGKQLPKWLREIGKVDILAFFPDGKRLLIAGQQAVRIWDWQNKKRLQDFPVKYGLTTASFSAAGRAAAVVEDLYVPTTIPVSPDMDLATKMERHSVLRVWA